MLFFLSDGETLLYPQKLNDVLSKTQYLKLQLKFAMQIIVSPEDVSADYHV